MDRSICSKCGASKPQDAPKGLCPVCLLTGGIGSVTEVLPPAADNAAQPTINLAILADAPLASMPERIQYFGDYELIERIAEGGMGVVFKARQVSLNRLVAVKMIRSGRLAGDQEIKRFHTEAEAAAKLQHSHLVAIHEVGEHEGQHYLSMDLIEGQSLDKLVRESPLPPGRAARIMKIVAEAIQYAHQRGVLHRDLKPSNVMLNTQDQPRVTDFGLAKLVHSDAEQTRTGAIMGSPSYMPPEQARGQFDQVGPKSDVYSLGAILYELLTGHPPFRAASLMETLKLVEESEPVAPRTLNPVLPRDLETICLKCLAKELSHRYGSAQELADELGRYLRDEPIQARPASTLEKTWRWCRRKPALASVLAVLVAVFAAGLAGVLWQWKLAQRNAVAALQQAQLAEERLYAADVARALRSRQDGNLGSTRVLIEAHKDQTNLHDFAWHYVKPRALGDQLITLSGHSNPVCQIVFSPNARTLATRDRGRTLKVWDLSNGKYLAKLQAHRAMFAAMDLSPDGRLLATGGRDRLVKLWDARTQRLLHAFVGHRPEVTTLAFAPDGITLATGDIEGVVKLWNLKVKAEVGTFKLHERPALGQVNSITTLLFSPDSTALAARTDGGVVRVWRTQLPKRSLFSESPLSTDKR